MKYKLTFLICSLALSMMVQAQTLNVVVGNVTYQFPASQTGEMTYADGTTLTIMGKAFTISDLNQVYVDNTAVTDNLVSVSYGDAEATVTVAGNVAQYVTPTISGAHVSIEQTNTDAVDDDEITYSLSGSTSDGEFALAGSYKCTVQLAGLTLTNPSGAAINITNKKRIQLSVKKETVNTLTDCANGEQKGCVYSKGQLQLQGNGTLNVYGKTAHAIKSADYISVKNLTLNIMSAVSDGLNGNGYIQMKSGTVTISGVGDDAIQCDLDGDASTGETTDHEDEDSGNIYIEDGTLTVTNENGHGVKSAGDITVSGGTVNVTVSGTAAKAIKADGTVTVSEGTTTLIAKGDIDLSDTTDPSYTAGVKATNFVQNGGSVDATVTGTAGRGVAVEEALTINDGTMKVTSTAAISSSGSSYFCTAKALKGTTVAINGGTITITSSGGASKGIKADDGDITITGGTITVTSSGAGAYDGTEQDAKGSSCINADGNMTISGGTLTLKSTGTGGKGIKADGILTVEDDAVISATSTGSQYKYSSSKTSSPKAIKAGLKTGTSSGHTTTYTYSGGIVVTGGTISASSSNHEAIESKNTIDISGGVVYAYSSDDAINSGSTFTISGGYVMGNSSGNDGLDANGNCYIKGGTVFAIASTSPEVGIDANTEGGYQLYVSGGTLVAIGGLESGSSLTQSCYQASSYSKGKWYALYNGSTLALAFKVPSNNSMGSPLVVSTSGTASLKADVTTSGGTSIWEGFGVINGSVSGGSTVSLSSYSGGNGGGGGWGDGGGGGGGGGGGRW